MMPAQSVRSSSFLGSRRFVIPRFRALVLLTACAGLVPVAAAQSKDGDALVIVNDKAITRKEVVELLLESHGLEAMQQLIVLELARQETRRRGIKVAPADVQAEFQRSLNLLAPAAGGSDAMTEENKRKALEMMLEQKGVSFAEFMVGMERNAHLRKIVEQDVKVSDATLREEFARTYGEKVQIRHIQVAENRDLNEAVNMLNNGVDFAAVAQRLSRNAETAARGGELPPFAFNDENIPPVLREAAFSLKPGEVSPPIRVEKWFHIVKLERRLPPENVRFEDVRGQVEVRMRERVATQGMNKLATDLFQRAKIRVLDPRLKTKFDDLMKRNAAAGLPGQP